jgi:glyoxylase-like metal-dependent hydrolase (beta-lactamase superfamily II)
MDYYYTPGHSDDSLSFMLENNLICGDAVRLNKLARTDLPTSSLEDLEVSNIFFRTLDENLMVFNGHDKPDSLKNFFIFRQEKTL